MNSITITILLIACLLSPFFAVVTIIVGIAGTLMYFATKESQHSPDKKKKYNKFEHGWEHMYQKERKKEGK